MVTAALEVERKLDVDVDLDVPDLAGVAGVAAVGEPRTEHLSATYYDTRDLRLLSARTTLRHRTGGHDDGWHLKLPSGAAREELAVDAPAGDVPAELVSLVRARSRHEPLVEVAHLSTVRVVRHLLDSSGAVLAEVADDTVHGRRASDGSTLRWREWEVELVQGDVPLLDAVEAALQAAGARAAARGSKAARVLGDLPPRAPAIRSGSAGAVVQAHLAQQVERLLARDPQARRGLPDGVHRMRVATRRLRSALATFRPVLDRAATDPLRAELRWLAQALGQVRDTEVVRARLTAALAAEPPDLVLGKVQQALDLELARRHDEARTRLLAELDGDRYLALLDRLVRLADDPPLRPKAERAAARALAPAVRREFRRLDRAMERAARTPPGPWQDELLHEVRKQGKRTRYAVQAVREVFGAPARRTARELEALQEVLGQLQDSVAARVVLRELGARGHLAGRNGFTFGRLHALEQVHAEAARDAWLPVRARLQRRRLRRWAQDASG